MKRTVRRPRQWLYPRLPTSETGPDDNTACVLPTIPPDSIDVHHAHSDVLLSHRSNVAHMDAVHLDERCRVALLVRSQVCQSLGEDVDVWYAERICFAANVDRECRRFSPTAS